MELTLLIRKLGKEQKEQLHDCETGSSQARGFLNSGNGAVRKFVFHRLSDFKDNPYLNIIIPGPAGWYTEKK